MIHTTEDTKALKAARTEHGVLPIIRDRFSARAFSPRPITPEVLHTLFEAASWAPSAMNEQPWRYRYALRGTPMFDRLWDCLYAGNRPWAKNAAALVVSSAMVRYHRNAEPNGSWQHDAGLANGNLLAQATSMDIFAHFMGGFDHEKAGLLLGIDPDIEGLICLIALGYLGDPDQLEEPFRSRERAGRQRRPLSATVTAL